MCSCSVLAPKYSHKESGDELAFLYLNRCNKFKYLSNNQPNTSAKRTCKDVWITQQNCK